MWAGPFFDGRTYSMRSKGKPMATVIPKEGVYSLFNYLNPVKGAGKREAMLAYIEQALSDEAVGPLVEMFRYGAARTSSSPKQCRRTSPLGGHAGPHEAGRSGQGRREARRLGRGFQQGER